MPRSKLSGKKKWIKHCTANTILWSKSGKGEGRWNLRTKTGNVVPLPVVVEQNTYDMKILGKYTWALLLIFGALGCVPDDDQEILEPELNTTAAIDLIEQASLSISMDNANWNAIVLDLEQELEAGGQFGYFLQVSNLRQYAERGVNTGIACVSSEMSNWIRGQLLAIVRDFQGLEVEDPFPVLCGSNLEGLTITNDQFTQVNKLISLYGYDLAGEFQMIVNLENDTAGTSDKVSTSLVELFSEFELAVNLVIFEYSDLTAYEYLRVYFQGEQVIEIPIE